MTEENQKPEEPPLPPRVLEYGRPEKRERRFGAAVWTGVGAFMFSGLVEVPLIMIAAEHNLPVVAFGGLALVVCGVVWWGVYSYRKTRSLGFVAGFLLIPGVLALLVGVICGPMMMR